MNSYTDFDFTGLSRNKGAPFFSGGFTLVEILIAVFIFSVIGVMMFTTFNATIHNTEALGKRTNDYEMGRNCLNRIILDLQSIYICLPPQYAPPEFGDPPEPYHLLGDAMDIGGSRFSRLRFTSFAHLPFAKENRDEIAEIVYYVHDEADGGLALRRSDHLYPFPVFEESGIDPILCDRIRSMTFTYFDQDNNAHETWDSEDEEWGYAMPSAIGVAIEFGDPDHPMVFGTTVALPVHRKDQQQTDTI